MIEFTITISLLIYFLGFVSVFMFVVDDTFDSFGFAFLWPLVFVKMLLKAGYRILFTEWK